MTHRCTLRCRQCPYWRRPVHDRTWAQINQLLVQMYERSIRIIVLKDRSPSDNPYRLCGFTAHIELSLAYRLNREAIGAGRMMFGMF